MEKEFNLSERIISDMKLSNDNLNYDNYEWINTEDVKKFISVLKEELLIYFKPKERLVIEYKINDIAGKRLI